MPEHDCIQREEVSSLRTSVDRLNKEMFNGDGIIKQVPVLSNQIDQLIDVVKELRESVQDLTKFEHEIKGGQSKVRNIVPWIAVIIAGLTLMFSMYNNSRVNTKLKDDLLYMEYKMSFKQDRIPDSTVRGIMVRPDTLADGK